MLELFGHPFSSYTWKALIAFYENDTPFTFRQLDPDHRENGAEFARHWPIGKFPLLLDGGKPIYESSIIIEYLQRHYPGPIRFLPDAPDAALEVRMLDRIFDNHVMHPMQQVVFNAIIPAERRDAGRVESAIATLDKAYAWIEAWLDGREWAAAGQFSLADCAAAPALFYADWVHRIPEDHANLRAYRARLLARPSMARCVDDARPYRHFFPLGAPDRD